MTGKASQAIALEPRVAVSAPRARVVAHPVPKAPADARRFLPLYAALSLAVLTSPVLLDATLANDWSRFWQLIWLGFDLGVAASLVGVAVSAYRRSPWLTGWAATAGGLLACDAWLDVMTASDARHMILTGVIAMTLELPLMALCLTMGSHAGSAP
jgi:hypothetical protein